MSIAAFAKTRDDDICFAFSEWTLQKSFDKLDREASCNDLLDHYYFTTYLILFFVLLILKIMNFDFLYVCFWIYMMYIVNLSGINYVS
jgi:hypothetical protein